MSFSAFKTLVLVRFFAKWESLSILVFCSKMRKKWSKRLIGKLVYFEIHSKVNIRNSKSLIYAFYGLNIFINSDEYLEKN